jgi:serpin B
MRSPDTLVPVIPRSVLDRRRFLALLALPAVGAVLQACGGDDGNGTGDSVTPGAGPRLVRSNLPRVPTTVEQAAEAVAALNAFGWDLYGALVEADPDAGLVLSPASIALALTMARAGAVGATAEEMDAVLHIADPATIHRSMNALSLALESRSGTFPSGDESAEVLLSIVNAMWGQDGTAFQQPFLDVLAEEYGAGLQTVDFATDPESARARINAWVDSATRSRIRELLPEGSITDMTRLTLVNAIYLKAAWVSQFDPAGTTPAPFTLLDASTVDVPMMRQTLGASHAEAPTWQAIELPYIGDELAMLIVVPTAGAFRDVESELIAGGWDGVASSLAPTTVQLGLPRWETETSVGLADALTALGMPTAFTDAADFSGISTETRLNISDVVHQANITVDETGTEAAAATAVVIGATSAPVDIIELTVDRPFLYALRDRVTGAVVFQGRVTTPST